MTGWKIAISYRKIYTFRNGNEWGLGYIAIFVSYRAHCSSCAAYVARHGNTLVLKGRLVENNVDMDDDWGYPMTWETYT